MVVGAFVAPYLLDATARFVEAAVRLPGMELAVITCEPADRLCAELRRGLAGHWRIDDALDAGQIGGAVQAIGEHLDRYNGSWRCSSSCRYRSRRSGSS